MKDTPALNQPALENIYLRPTHAPDATDVPLRDEETRLLRDEQGNIIYEDQA
jgi:hypothetical protein